MMKIDWLWLENPSTEEADTMLTFATATMIVIFLQMLFGGSTLVLPFFTWNIQKIDAALAGTLLASTLTAYVARRYTDKKFDTDGDGVPDSDTPKK
jgi:heme A synthase